jgi:hypothetical protein
VSPGVGLDAVKKRKISCPCQESKPNSSNTQQQSNDYRDFLLTLLKVGEPEASI